MDGDGNFRTSNSDLWSAPIVAPPFIAPEILNQAAAPRAKAKLARIVETEIVPRLIALHAEKVQPSVPEHEHPTQREIVKLASLVLDPDCQLSADFVSDLKRRGLSSDGLFLNLLEPAARSLGTMWDNEECDFVDVTLGVARLQQLLSIFNASHTVPAFNEKRRVCMMAIAGEQHSLGVSMIEKFLWAGGWRVHSERGTTIDQIAPMMRSEWFAVVGLTVSSDRQLDRLTSTIQRIRQHSRNPSLGIMVGGPPFMAKPELAAQVGADATANNATTAVVLAQLLFDVGARSNWQNSYDDMPSGRRQAE